MDVLLAAGGASWEQAAIGEIEQADALRLARRCVDVADLLAVAQTARASAALVSLDLPGLDVDVVHRVEAAGVRVVAVEAEPSRCEGLRIRRRAQLGSLEDIALATPSEQLAADVRRAPVVAVWGPAGAPGRSTVALALASAVAARDVPTVLVDADTYGGSLGQALGVLDDVSGLVAACRAANQGRTSEIVDHLLEIDPGLRLLSGLPRADMWPQVRPAALDSVLDHLRASSEVVVVDCGFCIEVDAGPGATRNRTTLQVLEQADAIVLVGRPEPVGLARLVRAAHDLAAVVPHVSPFVVVNQARPSLGWAEREVRGTLERLTGLDPVAMLPHDQSGLDLAAVSGRTPREVAPSSPFVTRIEALAAQLMVTLVPPVALAARHA